MATYIVGAVVFILAALAVRQIIKRRGEGACGGHCDSCPFGGEDRGGEECPLD